jgi:hypothetical protein
MSHSAKRLLACLSFLVVAGGFYALPANALGDPECPILCVPNCPIGGAFEWRRECWDECGASQETPSCGGEESCASNTAIICWE